MGEPRWLHPAAWWAWALGLATAASRTTNPLLLVLIVLAAAAVVHARRPLAPWGRSFSFFLRLGAVVIVVRLAVQLLFGTSIGTTEIIWLPGFTLPSWLAGIRLGGEITLESMLLALYDGMRLATILVCVGAANSLASPTRLLKSVPAALYELGVSVVVALTFTPQLVSDVERLRTARRLRGRTSQGPRAVAASAVPVLEGALERAVTLAAAMDSRGYGRRGTVSVRQRRLIAVALLGGLVAACVGSYAMVSADSPAALGLPLLVIGVAAAAGSLAVAGRTATRTTYRPDPWRLAEWLVLAAGVAVAVTFAVGGAIGLAGLDAPVDPPGWPTLPLVAVAAIGLAATPAWTAPRLPAGHAASGQRMSVRDEAVVEVGA